MWLRKYVWGSPPRSRILLLWPMFCFCWDVHAIFHMMCWKCHISWWPWWMCLLFLDLVWDGWRIGSTSHQCWSGWPVFRTCLLVSTRHAWGACCVLGPAHLFSCIFAWRIRINLVKMHLGNLIASIRNRYWRLGWWVTVNQSQVLHSCWCIHQKFLTEFPLSFCGGSVNGIYSYLVVRYRWRWIRQDRILFLHVCGPYVLWECEEQEILKVEWCLTWLRAKHQVLQDSDEFSNVRFAWYRRYWLRKCSVHVRFSHDGFHDEQLEYRIGALTPMVPSVFYFVVVIFLVIREERIGALTMLVPSVFSFVVVIVL